MNLILYRNCFLVGLTAAMAVGPIFVLVFNRAAIYGLKRGFATAIGAATGDGTLFGLSSLGILGFLEDSKRAIICMDLFVSVLLIFIAIRMLSKGEYYRPNSDSAIVESLEPFFITSLKAFLLTVINPVTIFFFMFISVKVMPSEGYTLSKIDVLIASAFLFFGSLTTFSTVAFIARSLHRTFKPNQLGFATKITAIAFLGLGLYFSFDLIVQIVKYFN